jgi:FkbM family methyltransferase
MHIIGLLKTILNGNSEAVLLRAFLAVLTSCPPTAGKQSRSVTAINKHSFAFADCGAREWTRIGLTELPLKRTLRHLLSRPSTQPVLLQLLKLCHAGLNYGGGQSVQDSGEVAALEFVRSTLGRATPLVLFDVGANDGEYLNFALRVLGNQVKAYSFEPQSGSFERLCARFGGDPRVELVKAALGREVGTVDLFLDADCETTASLYRNLSQEQTHSETVQQTTVDQVCAENCIEHIDLLKIDTEGYEMDVLLGASVMIEAGAISALQFEFGDTFLHTPYHFLDLWSLLSPRYTVYRILRHGLAEIRRYSPDLEIYKIANFLCMLDGRSGVSVNSIVV